jgi:hypothetical protein
MDEPEGRLEIQLEDFLIDLCTVDPVVAGEADCNRRLSGGHINVRVLDIIGIIRDPAPVS